MEWFSCLSAAVCIIVTVIIVIYVLQLGRYNNFAISLIQHQPVVQVTEECLNQQMNDEAGGVAGENDVLEAFPASDTESLPSTSTTGLSSEGSCVSGESERANDTESLPSTGTTGFSSEGSSYVSGESERASDTESVDSTNSSVQSTFNEEYWDSDELDEEQIACLQGYVSSDDGEDVPVVAAVISDKKHGTSSTKIASISPYLASGGSSAQTQPVIVAEDVTGPRGDGITTSGSAGARDGPHIVVQSTTFDSSHPCRDQCTEVTCCNDQSNKNGEGKFEQEELQDSQTVEQALLRRIDENGEPGERPGGGL